jgi:opacity protein-like surface antigen
MKKIFLISAIVLISFVGKAQFLNSIGITVGASAGKQHFYFQNPNEMFKKNYRLGFNGSVFAEFFSYRYVRWVSEFQYNEKGSIDKQPEAKYKNKLSYACWNNYLKLRYELFNIIPYILAGPRLEYKLTQKTTSPPITDKFVALHVSAAVGAGIEFISYGNIKFFVEGFYNPDIKKYNAMMGYITSPLDIKNINIELRVGLKYQFRNRGESCNTPTYIE